MGVTFATSNKLGYEPEATALLIKPDKTGANISQVLHRYRTVLRLLGHP